MSLLDGNYPKTYKENITERYQLIAKANSDLEFRAKVKELFHRDIIFAFNAFFYTLDVRKNPDHHQPFCTYPFQDSSILKIQGKILGINGHTKGDFGVMKSRDMGWSWMVILVFLHIWLDPKGGGDFLLGSRIEDYVDKKGDMRALLEKARYALYRLPKWLRPTSFNKKQHDNFMRLVNPQTGASITGESNNPNWSTGGRYLAGLLDEFGKWEGSDKSAWTAAGDATPCRIALSTPFGAGGQYYKLVTGGQLDVLITHWSLHPEKAKGLACQWPKPENAAKTVDSLNWVGLTSIWYEQQRKRRRPSELAQELDMSFVGSGNPVFEGKALQRIVTLLNHPISPVKAYNYTSGPIFEETSIPDPEDIEGKVLIYEEPNPSCSYIVSADVSEGKGEGTEDRDWNQVKVLRRDNENVVASYFGQIDEVRLAEVMAGLVYLYRSPKKTPWWVVETIGPGLSTFDQIIEKYPDLRPSAFMMPTGFDHALQRPTFRKGWWTSGPSKKTLIGGITNWLLKGSSVCNPRCTQELTTFEYKNGRAGARSGCFDDEVMCLGIVLQVNLLVPFDEEEIVVERMDSGLPVETFKPVKKEEPLSIEERCFASLMKKKASRMDQEEEFGGWSTPLERQLEDLGVWD